MFFELGSYAPWAAIALTVGVFVIFVLEAQSAEVVALGGAALALLFGLITVEDLLKAIENPAPAVDFRVELTHFFISR
jgi:Na+/H+ antiporter NhaD/arsenite permease-like protein